MIIALVAIVFASIGILVGKHLGRHSAQTVDVINKNRSFGAATHYKGVRLDGSPALFTRKELDDALDRGHKNPEDIIF